MSIQRRTMTPPCGQLATVRRVAPQRLPCCGAHLGHRTTRRAPDSDLGVLRRARCLPNAAEATRLSWHGVDRPMEARHA